MTQSGSSSRDTKPIDRLGNASNLRVAVVAGRYYEELVDRMVDDAVACVEAHGGRREAVDVFHVAGAFEVPQLAAALLRKGTYGAVVGLGVLIRGETPHFEFISSAVANQLCRLGVDHGVPVGFGVITADTFEQAVARAGGGPKVGKGWESMLAAIQLAGTLARRGPDRYGAKR